MMVGRQGCDSQKTMPRVLDLFQFLLVAVDDWVNQHPSGPESRI
jgi:hypothetical protein